VIVFGQLSRKDLSSIIDIEFAKVAARLQAKGLRLYLTEDSREYLIDKGYNPDFGARPLRRALEHLIEDPLAEDLLRGAFEGKNEIRVELEGGELTFHGEKVEPEAEPEAGVEPREAEPAGAGA